MTHSTSIGSRLRIPVGHLLKVFEDRVFGTLIFIFKGPNVVPVPFSHVRAVLMVGVFYGLAKVGLFIIPGIAGF